MGGGKERKMNIRLATANQERDGWKGLKQKFFNRERYKKYLIMLTL
jgi:hypothetical protein